MEGYFTAFTFFFPFLFCYFLFLFFRMITKQNYYFNLAPASWGYSSSFRFFKKLKLVGKKIVIFSSLLKFPLESFFALKYQKRSVLANFEKFPVASGFCIAKRNRQFGSSFILRNVESGVIFDRSYFFFSPKIFFLNIVPFSMKKAKFSRRGKAKLFFLKGSTNRKLIANFFS